MEKTLFLAAYSQLDSQTIAEVQEALIEFDPDLSMARRLVVPALNLGNSKLKGGEKAIRSSWWRDTKSNDFYIWDELADAKRGFVPTGKASFNAAAKVLCFFAFADVKDPSISIFQQEAATLVDFFRTRTLSEGALKKIPSRIEMTKYDWSAVLGERIAECLGMPSLSGDKLPTHLAGPDPSEIYQMDLHRLSGDMKFLEVERNRIVGFKFGNSARDASFLIYLLIRSKPMHNIPIRIEIKQGGELLRESKEILVSSDKDGFYEFRDTLMSLRIRQTGWLEFMPFFAGIALPSRRWRVVKEKPAPFKLSKILRDQP